MFEIINSEAEIADGAECDTIFILKNGELVEVEVPDDDDDTAQ